MLASLTSDTPSPSPFPRHTIKVYEEPRLREQDFGNFQPCSAEMSRMWQERADYGHFFYRIPNGESAADAYDRVSGFNESLWRSFGEDDFASVCVLVTHGLMTRVFLMKWYHFSVEYFEDLRNMNHCEFVVMRKNPDNGKYILQNQLRTWSELRKERAALPHPESPVPVRKKWGGCPDGCEHTIGNGKKERERVVRRQNTADLFREDGGTNVEKKIEEAISRNSRKNSRANETRAPLQIVEGDENGHASDLTPLQPSAIEPQANSSTTAPPPPPPTARTTSATTTTTRANPPTRKLSPNRLAILKGGRDGGGSMSGAASRTGSSDEDISEEEELEAPNDGEQRGFRLSQDRSQLRPARTAMSLALSGELDGDDGSGMKTGARADALGDQSDMSEEEEGEIERLRKREEGVGGSVY